MTARAMAAPAAIDVETSSAEQTRDLAAHLAAAARAGDRLALVGPLGAGKTQFAKGFAVGLGINEVVNSPSFTLMAEYAGRLALFHQDLYRLGGVDDALAGGLLDERQTDGVTLTEWADRLPAALDPDRFTVRFVVLDEDHRHIQLLPGSANHARYLEQASTWAPKPDAPR